MKKETHMKEYAIDPIYDKRQRPEIRFIRKSLFSIIILILFCSVCLTFCHAADPEKEPDAGDVKTNEADTNDFSETDIKDRIKALEQRIEQVADLIKTAPADAGSAVPELQQYESRLINTLSTCKRIENALKKKQGLEKEQILLKTKLESAQYMEISEKPPFSLSFYNTLLDTGDTLIQQKETINADVSLSKRAVEDISTRLDDVRKRNRQRKDQLATEKEPQTLVKEGMKQDMLTSNEDLVIAMLAFEKLKNQNALKELEIVDLKIAISDQRKAWVAERVTYNEEDLKKQIQSVSEKRDNLKNSLLKLAEEREEIERTWMKAQQNLAEEKDPKERSLKEKEVAEREAWRKTCQAAIEFTEDRLRLLDQQERNWKNRYSLLNETIDQKKIPRWRERAVSRISEMNRTINLQQKYQLNTQAQIVAIEKMITDQTDEATKAILSRHVAALRKLSERSLEYVTTLIDTLQHTERLVHEIDRKVGRVDFSKVYMAVTSSLENIWNFEVWVIDDRPVTIKKLCVALIILIIGISSAKYVIRIFWRRRVSKYLNFRQNTASVIEKVLFYFALFLIILLVLRIVNIPLGAFAFLGGAIAIGIGFGAQNLINNFISGFIIMIEQPIRVGDLIEIDGFIGQVEEIGARCTRIRTGDNLHILVPNSGFLEKNIVNWTIINNRVRASVTVGVSYGSPVEKVRKLLIQCAEGHEKIFKTPEPFVWFTNFGDSALIFSLYFWVNIERLMEKSTIESDIRFAIDHTFQESGIVMAFPQMDVHIHSNNPLAVKWDGKKG